MHIITRTGDTVDEICWRHYGTCSGVTEQVWRANPGLCERGPLLPAGVVVFLPDIASQATMDIIQLWD